jgi:GntR family transcriptional regulator
MNPKLPLYAQLKEAWIAAIAEGEYSPGDRLPSQRALAEKYNASHMTVRRAINELIHEGVIYAIGGKGIYVAEQKQDAAVEPLMGFTEYMGHRGMAASTRVLQAELQPASTVVSRALDVEVGTPLVYLRRLRLADDLPVGIQSSYLPHDLCPGLLARDFKQGSLFTTLREDYNLRLTHYSVVIEAGVADEEQASLLGITVRDAVPVLIDEQITYSDNGRPVEFVRSIYRGDRFRLRLATGKSHRRVG